MDLIAVQQNLADFLRSQANDNNRDNMPSDGARGLEVYRSACNARLIECLETFYPCTRSWLGEDRFAEIAALHVANVAMDDWALETYAAGFPATVRRLLANQPEAVELCELELAINEAALLAGQTVLQSADLDEHIARGTVFRVIGATALMQLRTNASEILSAISGRARRPEAIIEDHERTVLVWRQRFSCRYRRLGDLESALIPHLFVGMDYATLCARIARLEPLIDAEGMARNLLERWTGAGMLRQP